MRYFITGGAGFIGSNLTDRLLSLGNEVVAYDNFSTGRKEFLADACKDEKFTLIEGDILDLDALKSAMRCGGGVILCFILRRMPMCAWAASIRERTWSRIR